MRVESTFTILPGQPAPQFSLPDSEGKIHHLDSLRGPKGLLVVFACNHCPYVIHLATPLGKWAHQAAQRGVNTVAIVSNDLDAFPQDGPEHMPSFAKLHDWTFPYLIDTDQSVAKAYAAACTPDFFLFDADGTLYYAGQFDGTRPRSNDVAHGTDLYNALDAMLNGTPAPTATIPSCGCNIKWRAGQEPSWFPVNPR